MKDDEGVANVVGAILLLGIMVSALVMVQSTFVPVWGEDEETAHSADVLNQFARIKSTTDGAYTNQSSPSISHAITGSSDGGRGIWMRDSRSGDLHFQPAAERVNVSSPAITVLVLNGKETAILSEKWIRSNSTDVIEGVGELEHLRLRLSGNGANNLEFKKNGFVRAELHDQSGEFAGSFMAYAPEKFDENVWVRIRDSTGYTVLDQQYSTKLKLQEHGQFWINALDPSLPFREVLDATEGPYNISLSYDFPELDPTKWPLVDYAIAYSQKATSGQDVLFGSAIAGKTLYNYQENVGGGRLVFSPYYQHAQHQEVSLENGAIIVAQGDGAVIAVPPDFTVSKVANVIAVSATIPALQGSADSASQGGSMTVQIRPTTSTSLVGTTTEWSLSIPTAYPTAWASYFDRTMAEAGIAPGMEYTVTQGTDNVTLRITGDPANGNTHDVQIKAAFPRFNVGLVV